MDKLTYTDPVTGCDFMVNLTEDGRPEKIYCYNDNRSNFIRKDYWKPGQNKLFLHCPRVMLLKAYKAIKEHCVCMGIFEASIIATHY